MAVPSERLGRGLQKAREAFLVVDGGKRAGRMRAHRRALLARELVDRFAKLRGSNIDPSEQVAIAVRDGGDGTTVKVLTFGEIAEAIVDAGWKPPREQR